MPITGIETEHNTALGANVVYSNGALSQGSIFLSFVPSNAWPDH